MSMASRRRAPEGGALRKVRGEGGSVLMEGVLVLPLYLMVLGALFIVGDLIRARLTLQSVERSLTWLHGDRYVGHDDPGMGQMLAAIEDKVAAPVTGAKVDEMRKGGRLVGNTWLDAFIGYAVMEVKVPWWCGMADAEAIMFSRETDGEEELPFSDSYVLPEGLNGEANRQYRNGVLRRRPAGADKNRDRNAPGIQLADTGWANVAGEPWITGGGPNAYHDLPASAPPGNKQDYQRYSVLVPFGE